MLLLDAVQNVLHSLLEAARAAGYSGSLVAEIAESQMMLVEKNLQGELVCRSRFSGGQGSAEACRGQGALRGSP